jgi:HEAT repeat protein
MRDPDERARRAALQASFESGDSADLPELLEAARLDPDPLARSLAIRASGALGGRHALLALDDLWPRAAEPARLAIVDAWSMPRTFAVGGRQRLITTAESLAGLPSVASAAALTRTSSPDRALAAAVLTRAISEGTEGERRLALRVAPFADSDVRKAVHDASSDADLAIRIEALTRLAEHSKSRPGALSHLRRLAKTEEPAALRAQEALAEAGDPQIVPNLVLQLKRRESEVRRAAALSLVELGSYADAAMALADDDPEVRADVACSVLSADEP